MGLNELYNEIKDRDERRMASEGVDKLPEDCDPRQPGETTEPDKAPLEERRRCAAMGMALQDREIIQGRDLLDKTRQSTDALIAEAKKIEAYLRGDQ